MPEPNTFIVGAPKCGTTSLARWLAEHPQAYVSPLKEPHYFNTDHAFRNVHSEADYQALFAQAGSARVIAEASTWYLHSEQAVPTILRRWPRARFIVCLRDPAEMAASLHAHFLLSGREHIADFLQAWQAAPARAQGRQLGPWVSEPAYLRYPDSCRIGSQLARLQQQVPASQLHLVVLDDVRREPRGQWQQLQHFLGLDDDGRSDFPTHNAGQRLRSVALHRTLLRLRGLRAALGLQRWGRGLAKRFNRAPRAASAPRIPAEVREHFAPEVSLLFAALGRRYSEWE